MDFFAESLPASDSRASCNIRRCPDGVHRVLEKREAMILEERGCVVAICRARSDAPYDPASWISESWAAATGSGLGPLSASVELLHRRGGNPQRALLGGTYTPDSDDRLCLRIATCSWLADSSRTYDSQFGGGLIIGLPVELAGSIGVGLRQRDSLRSGMLEVNRAAYDDVDSSERSFENVSELLGIVLDGSLSLEGVNDEALHCMRSWN
jgi:hypothetical protein